jgi:FKBP-type peptidyl-prolyl cis-trans isomerase FkpA
MRRFALLALVCGVALAGCTSTPSSPTPTVTFTQSDLRLGSGTEAVAGMLLTVQYTGWLYDPTKVDKRGVQFDTSTGRAPFQFTLGAGQVIAGWDQGLVGMKVGGVRQLIVPPSLGYGAVRNGPIPANASLVFEVELIDAKSAGS